MAPPTHPAAPATATAEPATPATLIQKGEGEGRSLVEAMKDGTLDGMQHFDGEIEKMIRAGTVDREVGLSYATNAGNLRLEMADLAGAPPPAEPPPTPAPKSGGGPEIDR